MFAHWNIIVCPCTPHRRVAAIGQQLGTARHEQCVIGVGGARRIVRQRQSPGEFCACCRNLRFVRRHVRPVACRGDATGQVVCADHADRHELWIVSQIFRNITHQRVTVVVQVRGGADDSAALRPHLYGLVCPVIVISIGVAAVRGRGTTRRYAVASRDNDVEHQRRRCTRGVARTHGIGIAEQLKSRHQASPTI